MNNHVKTALIVIAVLTTAALLVAAGFIFSQRINQGFGYSMAAGNNTWRNNNFLGNTCNAGACSPGYAFQSNNRGMTGRFFGNSTRQDYGFGRGFGMMGQRDFGFSGSYGRGMGWNNDLSNTDNIEMSIGLEEAAEIAEAYLTANISGAELTGESYSFYRHTTFIYMLDGEISGMINVNNTTGQVWEHVWHGRFIEEQELEEYD